MASKHHPRLARQLEELGIQSDQGLDAAGLASLLENIDTTYAQLDDLGDTLMTVLDTLEGTNCHVDQDGLLRGVNDRGDTYFGMDSSTLVGRPLLEAIRIEDDHGRRLTSDDLHEERRIERGRVYRSDGTSFAASIAVSRIGPDRREQGAVVLLLDVDDRVAEEQALHDARIDALVARQSEQNKARFLANMSHELRTPLNAIIGYSELLLEEAEAAGATERLADLVKVTDAGRYLADLIGGILDLTKIEAGRMELSLGDHDLVAVVSDATETLRPQIERKGLTLELVCPTAPLMLHTDRTRVRQIVYNLLANALKFTEAGGITVTVDLDMDQVRIEVADTGIGISDAHLPRVFDEFEQADSEVSIRFGGTGLGLALSRRLCVLLGGDLTATSEEGSGSRFEVRLPR